MTIEELNENNERNHNKMMDEIKKISEELSHIPIRIKGKDDEPTLFPRNQFHQETYDTIHFKGWGGKIAKAIGFIIILLQVIILWKSLYK